MYDGSRKDRRIDAGDVHWNSCQRDDLLGSLVWKHHTGFDVYRCISGCSGCILEHFQCASPKSWGKDLHVDTLGPVDARHPSRYFEKIRPVAGAPGF